MYQENETCTPCGDVKESDVFETLKRIDNKLSSLEKKLSPITTAIPEKAVEQGFGTKLSNDLHGIENHVTYILDSVNL